MEVDKVIICRLCLKVCQGGFQDIDRSTQEALNFLLHVNLDISHDLVVCTTCIEDLKKCVNFKSDCLQKRNSKCTNLGNIHVSGQTEYLKEESGSSISNIDTCVFCMEMINLNLSLLLKNEEKNIITTLEKYFPELDLNITEDSITCTPCYKSMQVLVSFINSLIVGEEMIKEYCNTEGINSEGQIELAALLNFTFKNRFKRLVHGCNVVKVEDCNPLEDDGKIEIKSEDSVEVEERKLLDIKEEPTIKTEDDCARFEDGIDQDKRNWITSPTPELYKCSTCRYQSYSRRSIRRHIFIDKHALEIKLHACKLCAYETNRKNHMNQHMLTHKTASELTMHKCSVCPFESKRKTNLLRHMLIHKTASEVTMFKCDMCPFQSKHKASLQGHTLTHKTVSELTMHKCGTCAFETKYKQNLQKHMLIHKGAVDTGVTEEKMYECKTCSFQTKYKPYIRRHMLTHKSACEVKMFKCDMCAFQSKHNTSLRRHMLTHKTASEVTMFKGEKSTFVSKRRGKLRGHMLIHKSSVIFND